MDAGGSILREFLAWTEGQADEGARVIETVVPDPDDDAVRIMTIHAAKGLQFPIVVLTGLNVQPQHRPSTGALERRRTPGIAPGAQTSRQQDTTRCRHTIGISKSSKTCGCSTWRRRARAITCS